MNSIWEIFLNAVENQSDKIAVADQNTKYTYK